jgi:uroporphyrinogen decarboxylase
MNKRERVEAALTGKKLDRIPVSTWGHFFEKEGKLDTFVDSMLRFQEYYDWDYMKIQNRYTYHLEGWGVEYTQSGKPGDWPVITKYPIHETEDWKKLKVLRPTEGVLGEMLEAVKAIKKGLKGEVPFIMTVFSPLMIANHLAGCTAGVNDWKKFYESERDSLAAGLKVIAETFRLFVEELKKIGIDGLFYATKEASDDFTSAAEYQSYARPFDEIVLDAAKDFPFRMLHLCGDKIHLKAMANYPVTMLHWDPTLKGNPDYKTARQVVGDAVAFGGGPSRAVMAKGSPADVKRELKKILTDTEDGHFLLGSGCSVLVAESPEENMWILRKAPAEYRDY